MSTTCLHCSTVFDESSGIDGFCCAGCREVYHLIKVEGLGDYYKMQDRAADPVKDRVLPEVDRMALKRAQDDVEAGKARTKAIFEIVGLSCMGCVWLVQRLSLQQPGLIHAEASLSGRRLHLEWFSGQFDLSALAGELRRFGYHMEPSHLKSGAGPSSLGIRLGLCAIFTLNTGILTAYQLNVEHSVSLVNLLSLACLSFVFILGALPYYLTVFRAFKIRRIHVDFLPASSLLIVALVVSYFWSLQKVSATASVLIISASITTLLLVRYLISCLSSQSV